MFTLTAVQRDGGILFWSGWVYTLGSNTLAAGANGRQSEMQQWYQCPKCGAPVAFGVKFCGNCRTQLNWPTQQQQPPPQYQPPQQPQQQRGYGHGQVKAQQQKTSSWLGISIALIVVVALVGGGILAFNMLSHRMPPATPPPAGSPLASDVTAPTITNVIASPTETSAVITWTTNEPATSQVEYGTTTDYGATTTVEESLVTSHMVTLSGLKASATYHFRVKSKDGAGNEAVSGDYTLTTHTPAPKAEIQIVEHRLVVEQNPPASTFTFIRGKVKNTGEVTVASLDITIWIEYEVEGLEGQTFNMPGSIDLQPAAFKPGEIRDFDVLVQNGAKEGYQISVSVTPP